MTRLTVIVPAHNAAAHLAGQLNALSQQRSNSQWELLVVDHGSQDGTGRLAREMLREVPNASVVRFDGGSNVAAARNYAGRIATGTALAFCDADDVVGAGWVDAMATALSEHRLVTGSLDYSRLNFVAYRGEFWSKDSVEFFGVPVISSANFGCDRTLWETLGGFDERFDGAEDLDFSLRAYLDFGATPYFAEEALVHYRLRSDLRSIWDQSRAYGEWQPALMKQHAGRLPRPPRRVRLAIARYGRLLSLIPRVRDLEGRRRLIFNLGFALGRLSGSIRHRYIYL